eukprot:8834533-Pyramimonas_sp.AAC.1
MVEIELCISCTDGRAVVFGGGFRMRHNSSRSRLGAAHAQNPSCTDGGWLVCNMRLSLETSSTWGHARPKAIAKHFLGLNRRRWAGR